MGYSNYKFSLKFGYKSQVSFFYVVWQEIFDIGANLKPKTIVEVWKGWELGGWQEEVKKVSTVPAPIKGAACIQKIFFHWS